MIKASPEFKEKCRAYIARPADWELKGICPLRRLGSSLLNLNNLAYMLAIDATRTRPVIYIGLCITEPDKCQRVEYPSMDALLDEWGVD
jgi:hypothetical protein